MGAKMKEVKYFTINNESGHPLRFFETETGRDKAFDEMNDTYKSRFSKGVAGFKIER